MESSISTVFKCSQCGKAYKQETWYKKHILSHNVHCFPGTPQDQGTKSDSMKKQRPEENLNKTMDVVDVVDVAVEKALLKQLKKVNITEVYGRTVSKRRTKFSLSYDIPPPNYLSGRKGTAAQREHFAAFLNQITFKTMGMNFRVKFIRQLTTFGTDENTHKCSKDIFYLVSITSV
ncbi:uncharacterized protein LOC113205019 isoform X1 [Frankliniella occidentalis]|uniref:Uncharacterized protein LOC113205019 isoform X1 n=1 Tax=Frankliniella occidentalis TaxID=133901 RepID=A0A6J1S6E4_FRAOC|nr:uncharacterized protein LOC113205019 isoform X1 [Frankliniella occidentalis]